MLNFDNFFGNMPENKVEIYCLKFLMCPRNVKIFKNINFVPSIIKLAIANNN